MTETTANILVVDDDEKTLVAIEALLSAPGRNIIKASSGQEALRQLLLRQDFAVILLDVRIPDMDGFETAALIRQRERLRYVPIIFLSAIDTLETDILRGATSGAVDYLFKPVVPQVLQSKVSVFVNLYQMSEHLKRQAVRQSEERFRLVVESLQDYAVFMIDPRGEVSMWNIGAQRSTGWELEEVINKPFEIFFTPEDRELEKPDRVLSHAASEGRYEEENWRMRKDGSRFWASVVYTRVLDDAGNLVGFSVVGRDLTERKRADEQLQQLNADLEKRVLQRTTELLSTIAQRERLQEQLLQSQKLESIGTLAAGIAHDFNNLLNVISSYASILQLGNHTPERMSESIDAILETVQSGASLTQQLLALGRKTEMKFESVDLNTLLAKLQQLLIETIPKTIVVSLHLQTELPAIMANPNHLNQALLNLCVNSRDAMAKGGTLSLRTETVSGSEVRQRFQEAKEEHYVCLTVEDTGIGIDESTQSRMFEPFFTTKPQGEGTGLGLSVVWGIVTNHGGFIDVSSRPEHGTTFQIYLPIPDVTVTPLTEFTGMPQVSERFGAGETILFVEDEEKQLHLMRILLERQGYRVLAAKDGAEAVDLYLRHKEEIALVVLDLGLPKLNGWEAFQRMREYQPALKAIFATGLLSTEIEAEMARGKIGGVIMKPYRLDEVLQKIAHAIGELTVPLE
jgi:two-component system, cell cycle sensor histidine kinase and response regulator CckA